MSVRIGTIILPSPCKRAHLEKATGTYLMDYIKLKNIMNTHAIIALN